MIQVLKKTNFLFYFLLAFNLAIIFFKGLNFMPALIYLMLVLLGVQIKETKRLLITVCLILIVVLFNYNMSFYVFIANFFYYILPLLLSYFVLSKLMYLYSILFSFINFIIPFLIFQTFNLEYNNTYLIIIFSIYQVLHLFYLLSFHKYDNQYFYTFFILIIIFTLTEFVGLHYGSAKNSVFELLIFLFANCLSICILYIFKNYFYQKKNNLNISIFIIILLIYSFNKFKEINTFKKKENIVVLDNKMGEVRLYNKGNNFTKLNLNSDNIIMLNFWATWCRPCIIKIHKLNKNKKLINHNEYFVSFEDSATVYKFIKKNNLNIPIFHIPKQDIKYIKNELNVFPSSVKFEKDKIIIQKGR